jgi:hypothetical protein
MTQQQGRSQAARGAPGGEAVLNRGRSGRSRRFRWTAISGLLLGVLGGTVWSATPQGLPARVAEIQIEIGSDARATVRERYHFVTASPTEFQYLSDPCSEAGPVSIAVGGTPVDAGSVGQGPWMLLALEQAARRAPAQGYSLSYTVQLSGQTANIPLVMPSQPLESVGGYGAGIVRIDVAFPGTGSGASVVLPQMKLDGRSTSWSGSFLAIPSFVRVHLANSTAARDCRQVATSLLSSGALEWLFAGFGASLVAWIAFYMFWARGRHGASEGTPR